MGKDAQGKPDGRYQLIPRTLCFIFHNRQILLLKGAPDKRLWANLHNGVGGHVEQGEDFASAARREIAEETGLQVQQLVLRGLVTIDVEPQFGIVIGVFSAQAKDKHHTASAEGDLIWFPTDNLPPKEQMVEDLPFLLEQILHTSSASSPFCAQYSYDHQDRLHISLATPS